jgi:5-formaminoimidazole-4-carboxamide-1-beta-D-ribofuranosyl 5'-monophosphate synthetase
MRDDIDLIWILKPGENTNRGKGIFLSKDEHEIKTFLESSINQKIIIQKYIINPLLINKRKFDIRMYGLVHIVEGK